MKLIAVIYKSVMAVIRNGIYRVIVLKLLMVG
nr:MAG TPA: hypothetical protein [Caudoviricetes sp.]